MIQNGATRESEIANPEEPTGNEAGVGEVSRDQVVIRQTENVGNLVKFFLQVVREVPTAVRLYPADIFRHAGQLVGSNVAIMIFSQLMFGLIAGISAAALMESAGASSYTAAALVIGGMRGVAEIVFGWMLAAKAGCGIVAELGAMRINHEIDALEVMGVRPIAYLVVTRVIGAAIILPFLWTVALGSFFLGNYVTATKVMHASSEGGHLYVLFLFQNLQDFIYVMIWAIFLGLVVIIVACYYGVTAKGGPVGVGRNTAQSMLVNLVLISVIAVFFVQLFYGTDINAPILN